MQSETLKPCPNPWCVASDTLFPVLRWDSRAAFVECNSCGMQGPSFLPVVTDDNGEDVGTQDAEALAIAGWNNRIPAPPADSAGLVERLKYCDEHGIFKAVEDRMSASYDEAAHHIAAQDAEIARYKGALNRLEKAASDYGMTYLLDECETPELCGIDDAQHVMIVELSDAAREARAALNPETSHD